MVKRYRRYRKRYRKSFRKRRYRKRYRRTKYDGVIYAKSHHQVNLVDSQGQNNANVTISWGQRIVGPVPTVLVNPLDVNNLEVVNLFTTYREYRLVGIKITTAPLKNMQWAQAAANPFAYTTMIYGSDQAVLDQNTGLLNLQTLVDCTQKSAGFFKKYISVGKYFAKKDKKWLNTNGGIAVCDNYPTRTSIVRYYYEGAPYNGALGTCNVTCYWKFKSLTL